MTDGRNRSSDAAAAAGAGRIDDEVVRVVRTFRGYAIALDARGLPCELRGAVSELREGETYRIIGKELGWDGARRRIYVELAVPDLPTTADGIAAFLAERVRGIGPELARAIVTVLGPHALSIAARNPERLLEVPGVGPVRTAAVVRAVREQRATAEATGALFAMGCTPGLARRLLRRYGPEAAAILKNDPYRAAREVRGVGFLTADRIARAVGIPPDHPSRLGAALLHVLRKASEEGHCALPEPDLIREASRLTGQNPAALIARLRLSLERGELVQDEGLIYEPEMLELETSLSRSVARLLRSSRRLPQDETLHEDNLTDEQRTAIRTALRGGVTVITGNPGTGKTTSLVAVARLLRAAGVEVAVACPTGRAAQRFSEISGLPASTVHRLLGYGPEGGFTFGDGLYLPAGAVLVDEASMLDLPIACRLASALPDGCALVLVGDADQLPPVGPGDVLRDLIRSGAVPCVRLSTIHRQARHSLIVRNAHRIAQGRMPVLPQEPGEEVLFVRAEDPEEQVKAVLRVLTDLMPRMGYDPRNVPVFCPMYRGPNGIDALNEAIRSILNPPGPDKPELRVGSRTFRVGDRVLQNANNYHLGVMNGELGIVEAADPERSRLVVRFPHDRVVYAGEDLQDLTVAWAISVHKSQGGEYPATITLLDTRHYVLLTRNLLYTALTRAREFCVVVGSLRAVAIAVRNASPSLRHSALHLRIRKEAQHT